MKNDIKTSLQNREFDALKDKHRVILRWATGVGKSKMAIDLVNHAVSTYKHPSQIKVAFIVAERAHIKNWRDEFNKWGLSNRMPVDILCYASLHKLKDMNYEILVLDEGHHCFTEKRKAVLETIKADYIYMLSATLSYQKIADIESIFGKFVSSTVTLKEAINTDILPDPKVNIFDLELDNTVASEEIVIGKGDNLPYVSWNDRAKYIYKKIPCIIQCTQRQKYNYLTESMEYWKQRYERSHNEFHRNRWVNLGSQRKRFLGELKTIFVKRLISTFPYKKRFICFCSSVAQANDINRENTISSKRPSKLNQMIIDAFNTKKLHRIFAVGMANEGLNLVDIQAGIIVQLDGKERLFIQKFGRSLRAEDPVTYIFYYKDTQDEKYLNGALENIDEKFIRHMNINHLTASKQ